MSNFQKETLFQKKIINNICKAALAGGDRSAHLGGALSIVDILTVLYLNFLNLNKKNFLKKNRNYFILSKGHACLAYYSVLAELGFFSKKDLLTFEKTNSFLLGHPVKNLSKGIDFSTGSLGMGMSIAVGLALGLKRKKFFDKKVFVVVGDGELNEGSCWESLMTASHHNLDNLVVIVDNNSFQQTGKNKDIKNMLNLKKKFSSFGFETYNIDGHNFQSIFSTLSNKKKIKKPLGIIAKTTKGKYLDFAENNNSFHHAVMTKNLYNSALIQINNQKIKK